MNLNSITEGLVIKNYKELCNLLNESIKTGKAKQLQLEDWERYFNYERKGNSFIIREIYTEPKPKLKDRTNGNNSIYNKYIQKLVLDLLTQQYKNGQQKIFLSTCQMFRNLNMINDNYTYGRDNVPKLSEYLEMSEDYIYEFYDISYSNLKNTLEASLKQLTNKSLIHWQLTLTVSININIEDENKNIIHKEIHRPATDAEIILILTTEKEILNEMGYDSKRDIVICKKWNEFITNVNKILKSKSSINYYYKCYDIIFNSYIEEERNKLDTMLLEYEERKKTKRELNNTVINKLSKNTDDRHMKVKEEYKDIIGTPNFKNNIEELRYNSKYVINNKTLANTLIDDKKPDIKDDIEKHYEYIQEENKKKVANIFIND
jgi:hypothetical protein